MILAVEMTHTDENGSARVFVEVAPKDDCIILCGTRAFMVCSSSEDAKRLLEISIFDLLEIFVDRVKHYCAICHPNVDQLTTVQLKRMKKCRHGNQILYTNFLIKILLFFSEC
jgi:hypothetical protein